MYQHFRAFNLLTSTTYSQRNTGKLKSSYLPNIYQREIIGVSLVIADEFTFFLAVPTMVEASAPKLLKFRFDFFSTELFALIFGLAVLLWYLFL